MGEPLNPDESKIISSGEVILHPTGRLPVAEPFEDWARRQIEKLARLNQELEQRVTALEAENAALQKRVTKLEEVPGNWVAKLF